MTGNLARMERGRGTDSTATCHPGRSQIVRRAWVPVVGGRRAPDCPVGFRCAGGQDAAARARCHLRGANKAGAGAAIEVTRRTKPSPTTSALAPTGSR
jgi:hypothetical protein